MASSSSLISVQRDPSISIGMKKKRRRLLLTTTLVLLCSQCDGAVLLLDESRLVSGSSGQASSKKRQSSMFARDQAYNLHDKIPPGDVFQHEPIHFDRKEAASSGKEESRDEQWQSLQAEWNANWKATPIDSDSRGSRASLHKGKEKAWSTPFTFSEQISLGHKEIEEEKQSAKRLKQSLKWTQQRSPFHSSDIGSTSSQSPHNIGLFNPDYPFLPSGRLRKSSISTQNMYFADQIDSGTSLLTSAYNHHRPPLMANGNVMKNGWTEEILDDDNMLSVPDEMRQARQPLALTRQLMGKKWFRWKPGEGYVLSRRKDFSIYKQGPGIALAQLLPPRDKPVLSSLPMIPNDSKRDFVWLIISSIFFFAFLAMIKEIRLQWRTSRKGKRRSPSLLNGRHRASIELTASRLANGNTLLTTSAPQSLRSRQRLQAQSFRDLCKFAILGHTNSNHTNRRRSKSPANRNLSRVTIESNGIATMSATSSGRECTRTTRRSTGPTVYATESNGSSLQVVHYNQTNGSRSADSPLHHTDDHYTNGMQFDKQSLLTTIPISSIK